MDKSTRRQLGQALKNLTDLNPPSDIEAYWALRDLEEYGFADRRARLDLDGLEPGCQQTDADRYGSILMRLSDSEYSARLARLATEQFDNVSGAEGSEGTLTLSMVEA